MSKQPAKWLSMRRVRCLHSAPSGQKVVQTPDLASAAVTPHADSPMPNEPMNQNGVYFLHDKQFNQVCCNSVNSDLHTPCMLTQQYWFLHL